MTGRKLVSMIVLSLVIWLGAIKVLFGQEGYPLTPISGADGEFEVVTIDSATLYRSTGSPGAYALFMYFRSNVEVRSTTVYVEVTYKDIGTGSLGIQYNATTDDYKLATNKESTDLQDTKGRRVALFELPNADFRKAQNLNTDLRIFSSADVQKHIVAVNLFFEPPPDLLTAEPSFTMDSHTVSTTVFHWYVPTAGQLSGPWKPIEGRENWTGLPAWWKSQIKQMMAANIDVLWVHLINHSEEVRVNLFQALAEMRSDGYDVPKVAPFLDPLITWHEQPKVDLSTIAGKDSLAAQYIRFFKQYFSVNTDAFADDYLAKIDGRLVLDTWHVHLHMDNVASLQRQELESRLQAAFAAEHPVFNNGVYMITTAFSPQVFSFADERTVQFELNDYFVANTHDGLKTVQLKGGYWDQNVRTPGDFLARDGGVHFKEAWDQIDETVNRVYIESWNEYDEGTGIYAGDTGEPYILPGSNNTNNDVWSRTNDPYEYIRTTAQGAANFNDTAEHDARILRHTIPNSMQAGEVIMASLVVRNEGDTQWSDGAGYRFGQNAAENDTRFIETDVRIDDAYDEIPTFGGIFRGRPKVFFIRLQAPETPGVYVTKWGMRQDALGWFGHELQATIQVDATTGIADGQGAATSPSAFGLSQNYPNPFNPQTTIRYELPQTSPVTLKVFNLRGQEVATLVQGVEAGGAHEVVFDASNLASGVYVYKIVANGLQLTQKLLLLK